jgi:cell division protein FtsB
MLFIKHFKQNVAASIVPMVCACFVLYLGYHGLYGERGLITMLRLKKEIGHLEFDLAAMREESKILQRRITLLRPESLDVDLLEERARVQLGYARSADLVIFDRLPTE